MRATGPVRPLAAGLALLAIGVLALTACAAPEAAGPVTPLPPGTYAFLANAVTSDVRVIGTRTHRVLGDPIKVGDAPSGLVVSPDGKWAYVTSQYQNDLRAIDTQALQVFGNPVKVDPGG